MGQNSFWTRFQNRFFSWFKESSVPESQETAFVRPDGAVSRFVFDKRRLTKDGQPKPGVFEPEKHPDLGRFETSICGMHAVSVQRLWELGASIRPQMSAIAAVEVPVAKVLSLGLLCVPDAMPDFPEHGVVVGWDENDKSKRISVQQELVAAHTAVHRPAVRGLVDQSKAH
jgi:hypothetical protein